MEPEQLVLVPGLLAGGNVCGLELEARAGVREEPALSSAPAIRGLGAGFHSLRPGGKKEMPRPLGIRGLAQAGRTAGEPSSSSSRSGPKEAPSE
mmetsp:Transcript_39107/g.125754  ORF Transcript_39107/g.125754 Transcript_39107/m.125754 type:complete len:94 (-) Transcript_39107:155-436(-)